MYLVDYHLHPYSHGEKNNYDIKVMKDFINNAIKNGISEIGFSDHDEFSHKLDWESINYLEKNGYIPVKKGLEFDFIPGREEEISLKIEKHKLDYSIGSVHFIDNWGFDNPAFIEEYKKRDIDQSYLEYFDIVKMAVNSGLFNIIGHFDLIKVFGYRPIKLKIRDIVKPILKDIKKNDLVLEINTNGLNRPAKEIYPSMEILEMAYQLRIPITFGSDAHQASRVGENIAKYAALLKKIGYKEITVFNKGQILFKKI